MDDPLAVVAASAVGLALLVVATAEFIVPGRASMLSEPFVSGVFLVASAVVLVATAVVVYAVDGDTRALRATAAIGLIVLGIAVLSPESLVFGGVFWLALVAFGLLAVAAYYTTAPGL